MSQISLYLDDDIHRELVTRAKLNNTSVSKFVSSVLKTFFSSGWPDGFHNTFGSITDETFIGRDEQDWSLDAPREGL